MSGINPLIDTLLHQVLSKRVDTPPARELNAPVRPVSPSDAPRALHSDSRLDARSPAPPGGDALALRRNALPRWSELPPGGAAGQSTQVHLTPAARSIADVLLRFPAPPAALRPPHPLLPTGDPAAADPLALAQRLHGSVRDSGLFYEAHLVRWYRGELPREQLLREPQMARFVAFTPAPAAAAAASISTPTTPPPGGLAGPVTPGRLALPPGGPAEAASEGALPERESVAPRQAVDPVHESLQGLVRHQLEMLVTPVLRWEGDVWTGLFMALTLHAVTREHSESDEPTSDASDDLDARQWRAAMTLEVAGLGEVGVTLRWHAARLEVSLSADEASVRETLAGGVAVLEARLAALQVRVEPGREPAS